MPRRSAAQPTTDVEQNQPTSLPLSSSSSEDLKILRTNWKWAAFSQFFYTFSPLFAMNDVSINDIEEDLVYGRSIFIPRIMVRLLFVLTYDRKVSLDNWQTVLRKQYNKRDPLANPIGPEPPSELQDDDYATPEPSVDFKTEDDADGHVISSSPAPESTRGDSVMKGTNEEDDIAARPLAKKYHYLVNEAQAAELEQRETKNWLDLPMLEKLDSMHLLTEWQFHNPTRVRTMMKTDDETAEWRIEPIGYDAKRNAYWLIGDERLWIQREPPRPPRPAKSLKRKRAEPATKSSRSSTSSKRQRLQANSSTKAKSGKVKARAAQPATNGKGGRAAKAQAKIKLDAQAKELAELNRQAALSGQLHSSRSQPKQKESNVKLPARASRPLGTRVSARLRGQDDDEWQAVPDEWLNEGGTSEDDDTKVESSSRKPDVPKTGLESDDESISDLTELSDESEESDGKDASSHSSTEEEEDEPPADEKLEELFVPENFVEWETICVTLEEWENITERWKNATHYTEKALYKVLTKHIVPTIIEQLRELERKRRIEDAVVHRKRSSRIAVKEQAKEEAKQAARRKAEEDEKMGRSRRAEARHLAQEAERKRREQTREQKRLEEESEENASEDVHVDIVGEGTVPNGSVSHQLDPALLTPRKPGTSTSGSRTPSDWELDCEICLRKGMNIDDGIPIMCCESCSKWQHIACHDRADQQAGRPRRNWEKDEFVCRQCRLRRATNGQHLYNDGTPMVSLRIPPASIFQNPVSHAVPYNPYAGSQHYMGNTYAQVPPAPSSKSISFSHYHPQQRGFSTTANQLSYNPVANTQSYSQLASQHHQYQEMNGQLPYNHIATTNGWNGAPAIQTPGYPYAPGYADPNGHWMSQQPPTNNTSTQFRYHPASYQAHS